MNGRWMLWVLTVSGIGYAITAFAGTTPIPRWTSAIWAILAVAACWTLEAVDGEVSKGRQS